MDLRQSCCNLAIETLTWAVKADTGRAVDDARREESSYYVKNASATEKARVMSSLYIGERIRSMMTSMS